MIKLGIALVADEGLAWVKEDKRFLHSIVLGESGSGKTNYLLNLINQEKNNPVIVLDPNGSLAEQVIRLDIDPARFVYVSKDRPISLNPLSIKRNKSEIANELAEVINAAVYTLNPEQMGITVLMQRILRKAIQEMEVLELNKLFDILDYKTERQKLKDRFWQNFDDKGMYTREQTESAKRIVARMSLFLEDENMVKFVKGGNKFDIPNIIKNKLVVVFNLRGFDDEVASYIGCLVTHQIKNYYLTAEGEFEPLYFYVDEFHRFFTSYFNRFLTEGRRFKVSCNLCTHSLSMMDLKLRNIILTITYIKAILGANADDAELIAKNIRTKADEILDLKSKEAIIGIGKNSHKVRCYPPPKLKDPFDLPFEQGYNFLRDDWFPA